MHILYVCNKCEECKSTKERDAFSDDEDEEEEQRPTPTRKLSKGEVVYERLLGMKKDCRKIERDSYFQISCKKIRNARHNQNLEDEFMQQFLKLINALISKFDECVYGSLNTALVSLYALATRVFDYFVSVKFLNQPMWESLLRKLTEVREKEARAYEELHVLIEHQCGLMNSHLKQSIKARKHSIVSAVHKRTFGTSLDALDTAGSPNKEQRAELAAVFQRVIYEEILSDRSFHEIRTFTQGEIINKIQTLLFECERLPGVGDLVPQLRSCFRFELLSNGAVDFCQNMYKKSLSFTLRAILDKILKQLNPGSSLKRQENLRQAVVRRFLERIDEKALGSEVARQLFAQLADSHNRFKSIMETIEKAHSSRKVKQSGLKKFIPLFSKGICDLRTLSAEVETLRSKPCPPDFVEMKSGHRNEVYVFGCAPRQHVQRRVKIAGVSYEEDVQKLAVLLNCGR
jgi:hypothetical protein